MRLFWIVPAGALLVLLITLMIIVAAYAGKFEIAHAVALEMFKIMFWITPAVGVVTILSVLVVRVAGLADLKRLITSRAIAVACLDIVAPFVIIILGIVLSGFTR